MRPHREEPGPGQESVWDYPRPPRLEPTSRHLQVVFNGRVVADSVRAVRVLETSHAPTYYLPPDDVRMEYLIPSPRRTICEWKGQAAYHDVCVGGRTAAGAAWSYPDPTEPFAAVKGYIAFYPHEMDACLVDGEKARPQPGAFYGGWVTRGVVGPFKGGPGSFGW